MKAAAVVVERPSLLGIPGLVWNHGNIPGSPYSWYRSTRTGSWCHANSPSSAPRFLPDESRWRFIAIPMPLWAPPVSPMIIRASAPSPRLDPASCDRVFSGLRFSLAKRSSPLRDSGSVSSLSQPSAGALWLSLVQHSSLTRLQSSILRRSYLRMTGWGLLRSIQSPRPCFH